ncbi:MAG: mandelate racemase [Phycisphaerales bacterium]|nr:mandelate racemase [Phycisphaerales bacterium]
MRLRATEVDLFVTDCRTRLPFRFGITTLTAAPLLTVRVRVETDDGRRGEGAAADLLVPKWFAKNPDTTLRADVESLLASVREAGETLLAARRPASVFDRWWELYDDRVGVNAEPAGDTLVRGFGVALLERTLIDAACRLAGRSFFDAVRSDLLGFDPGRAWPELADWLPAQTLPATPPASVAVRHTVGMLDSLTAADLAARDRVGDGLPETLEEDIRVAGLDHFKIKIAGDRERDLDRLDAIGAVLEATVGDAARITLDGNEQYERCADLAALLESLAERPRGGYLLRHLLAIEQPLARGRTFERAPNAALAAVAAFAPVLIDEADATLSSFPRAIALGYEGVSVKNCKGVFRALVNRGLCDVRRGRLFQSAEDLTNLPVLALQQDLATVATLGLPHVERNGHHYFRGLDHLPRTEAADALKRHPDLYEQDERGIALRIEAGRLSLASLHGAGYGYDLPIRFDERVPADAWTWPE